MKPVRDYVCKYGMNDAHIKVIKRGSKPVNVFTTKSSLWSLGFRPFFLLVPLVAVITTTIWVFHFTGIWSFDFSPLSPNQWHANEMIFGFIGAAIFGFLLTASANWTGTRGIHGTHLMTLVAVFLLARIVFWTTPIDQIWIYQVVGVLAPLWLVFHLAHLFIKTKNNRNLFLIAPLAILIVGQLFILSSDYLLGYEHALYAVRFLVVVIAGRVIPFFTKSVLKLEPRWSFSTLEKLNIFTVFVLIFEPLYRNATFFGTQIWIGLTAVAFFSIPTAC